MLKVRVVACSGGSMGGSGVVLESEMNLPALSRGRLRFAIVS